MSKWTKIVMKLYQFDQYIAHLWISLLFNHFNLFNEWSVVIKMTIYLPITVIICHVKSEQAVMAWPMTWAVINYSWASRDEISHLANHAVSILWLGLIDRWDWLRGPMKSRCRFKVAKSHRAPLIKEYGQFRSSFTGDDRSCNANCDNNQW